MLSLKKIIGTGAAIITTFVAFALYSGSNAHSSDHQDSNTMLNRPSADLTDVFIFPSPQTPGNVVLVMDSHPLIPAGMGSLTFFDPAVMYQFKLVHTATAYTAGAANANPEDTVIQFAVNGSTNTQTLTMHGPAAPLTTGVNSTYVASTASAPITYGQATTVTVTGANGQSYPVKVYAGPRADPFFFDLAQFFKIVPDRFYGNHANGQTPAPATVTGFRGFTAAYNTTNGTTCSTSPAHEFITSGGADIVSAPTGGFNVLSIIVEMPAALLEQVPGSTSASQPIVHLWATTSTTSGA